MENTTTSARISGSVHRQSSRVAVITPACGSAALLPCVLSVARQDLANVRHYVFVDGESRRAAVEAALGEHLSRVTVVQLPEATGGNGYNGHRIYGAAPFLVNADYVAFLDEDNFYNPDHLSSLVALAEKHDLDWVYSLRNVVSHDGQFICEDNCDSLGFWGSWPSVQHHIDTSCYLIRRNVAIEASAIWNRAGYSPERLDPDKALCRWLIGNKIKGFTTGVYTMNYRLGGSASSPTADFYRYGNAVTDTIYKYYPWRTPVLEEIVAVREYRRVVARHEPMRDEILARLKRAARPLSAPAGRGAACRGCAGARACSSCRVAHTRAATAAEPAALPFPADRPAAVGATSLS